ncbi:Uncharacterized protein TCM_042759 isoform 2 [Theobroma cacao]|uniref:Uncharacterized protein isoform 2 n=1 Tax=Theobroma cacao TaxID=3641 RepID=A0A061FTV1_THECC|nr:Uncharacterized protein TCM_042759 isoform 2 [Theobroma cacao]
MMECSVWVAAGDHKNSNSNSNNNNSNNNNNLWGLSHESEHDLALMVSDFLENNGGSAGGDSWCSSDSESGFSDLLHLSDKISYYKHPVGQYEDHEYIDVINYNNGSSERLIIDIDFRSHFEIARAVDSYDRILNSLPVVYVGSLTRLKQLLQLMVDAARSSLKQNSMPFPPWRSLAYLQAKWQSPYQRQFTPYEHDINGNVSSDHKQCNGHLKGLQASLQSELEAERLLKPINIDSHWRLKLDRRRHSSFRAL